MATPISFVAAAYHATYQIGNGANSANTTPPLPTTGVGTVIVNARSSNNYYLHIRVRGRFGIRGMARGGRDDTVFGTVHAIQWNIGLT